MATQYILCGLAPARNSQLRTDTNSYEVFGDDTVSGKKLRLLLGGTDGRRLLESCSLENVVEDRILEKKQAGKRGDELPDAKASTDKLRSIFRRAQEKCSADYYKAVLFGVGNWQAAVSNVFDVDDETKCLLERIPVAKNKAHTIKLNRYKGRNGVQYDGCRILICDHPAVWPSITQGQTPADYFNKIRDDKFPEVLFDFLDVKDFVK